ncbi:MAG: hypothetical protein AABZ31_13125 [Bdellovibrionota bacterium]
MNSKKFYLLITFCVAFCSLSYELLIARTLGSLTGDIVTSQSWTIGFYIAALGFGAMTFHLWENVKQETRVLFYNTEILLSLLGLLAVPIILLMKMWFEYKAIFIGQPHAFILCAQLMTFAVGYFSGFEIPLLLKLSQSDEKSESYVIGYHYFGSMVGAITAAYFFQPHFAAVSIGVFIASGNLLLSAIFLTKKLKPVVFYVVFSGVFVAGAFSAFKIDQKHAEITYFVTSPSLYAKSFQELGELAHQYVKVDRHLSPYQTIDIVEKTAIELSDEEGARAGVPQLTLFNRLYINSQLQVSLNYQDVYHETFAHVPINLSQKTPKKILILGGGDGILAFELAKYESVDITLVELDEVILNLAQTHPLLLTMNHSVFSKESVQVRVADAFSFMLKNRQKYDAIYADFPLPRDDELMRLFSLEFYQALRRALVDDGFLVVDTPGQGEGHIESRIADSLLSGGFENVYLYGGVARFALASVKSLDISREATAQNMGAESKKYFAPPTRHVSTGHPISLFRPGGR